ncbi:MAG: LysM peptidoglycan-binding domain-containing protein [Merdibacter sp.]
MEIYELNKAQIIDPNLIETGQVFIMPAATLHTIKQNRRR